MKNKHIFFFTISVIAIVLFQACSGNAKKEEVTAVASTEKETDQQIADSYAKLGTINDSLYETGKAIYQKKCTHCHEWETRKRGPALKGVTKRHSAEWIANLLANLRAFVKEDSIVTHTLSQDKITTDTNNKDQVSVPITTPDERKAIIEFFRKEG
ncbi:MAG TPA: cytochrome c [Bacteroidia bacterium]